MIVVSEYDPAWQRRFEQLQQEYAAAMAAAGVPMVAIEHVGSTSVPGLAAKPVIDCDIVVARPDVAVASEVLTGLGFIPEGELVIPLRWAFKEPQRLAGTNTYIVEAGSLALRNEPPSTPIRCPRTARFPDSSPARDSYTVGSIVDLFRRTHLGYWRARSWTVTRAAARTAMPAPVRNDSR